MLRFSALTAASLVALTLSALSFAQHAQYGTAAEAKAMVERVIKELKAEPKEAIEIGH